MQSSMQSSRWDDGSPSLPKRPTTLERELQVGAILGATLLATLTGAKDTQADPGNLVPLSASSTLVLGAQPEDSREKAALRAEVHRVSNSEEVVDFIKKNGVYGLFVEGAVGLDPSKQQALASWLAAEHPNWVVFLCERSEGEIYRDADGDTHRHDKAVEFRLGHELESKTSFGDSKDPRTNKSNGAILLITFDTNPDYRTVKYNGNEIHDQFGVGTTRWGGNLDQHAIRALKDGRRVMDAVKDTITYIENAVTSGIDRQARDATAAKERAEREAKIANDRAASSLAAAEAALKAFQTEHREFITSYPSLTGDLAKPPFVEFEQRLKEAKTNCDGGNLGECTKVSETFKNDIASFSSAVADYPKAGERLIKLGEQIVKAKSHPFNSSGSDDLKLAGTFYDEAKRSWEIGLSTYLVSEKAVALHLERAVAKMDSAQQIEAWTKAGTLGTVALAVIGALGFGAYSRRRSAEARGQAEDKVEVLKKYLEGVPEGLYKLDTLREMVLGKTIEDIPFNGETGEAARAAFKDVKRVCALFAIASQVVEDASKLLNPASAKDRIINYFSASAHRQVVNRLTNEPIEIDAETDIHFALTGKGDDADRELWARRGEVEPVKVSLDKLSMELDGGAARALEALQRIQGSVKDIQNDIKTREGAITSLKESACKLATTGSGDGLFVLPKLTAVVIPALEQGVANAGTAADNDPLAASKVLKNTEPVLTAVHNMIVAIDYARTVSLARIRTAETQFSSNGIAARWIGEALSEISGEANNSVSALITDRATSADKGAIKLKRRMDELSQRVAAAEAINNERSGELETLIVAASKTVDSARQEIGAALGIDPDRILREKSSTDHADPSMFISEAGKFQIRAAELISAGALDDAKEAVSEAKNFVDKAEAVVENTKAAFESHKDKLEDLNGQERLLRNRLPAHEKTLSELIARFPESALRLGAGDEVHPNANGTITDNLEEARTCLAQAGEIRAEGERLFKSGNILEAAQCLERVNSLYLFVDYRLSEIADKEQRLEDAVAENANRLEALATTADGLRKEMDDPQVRNATVAAFTSAQRLLNEANRNEAKSMRDPFAVMQQLKDVASAFHAVTKGVAADRALYQEVGRSIKAASKQINEAKNALQVASKDEIPDSSPIDSARSQIPALEERLAKLDAAFKKEAHAEWGEFDEKADTIFEEAGEQLIVLNNALEEGQKTLKAIQSAKKAMREAATWTGSRGMGVLISDTYGQRSFEEAMRNFERGVYSDALTLAGKASKAAKDAIQNAETEENRLYQAEQARIAAERARREAAREAAEAARRARQSSNDWSSSASRRSSGSTFGSSSFGRSSSGFRSSSVGRSSSGFSSSKW